MIEQIRSLFALHTENTTYCFLSAKHYAETSNTYSYLMLTTPSSRDTVMFQKS